MQPSLADFFTLAGRRDGAAGLGHVATVAEAAVPEPRPELDESVRELGPAQMMPGVDANGWI